MNKLLREIQASITAKTFIGWSQGASLVLGHRTFKPSDITVITKAFDEALAGASALLVDKSTRYSPRAPVAHHTAWLQDHGYTTIPGVRETVNKPVAPQDLERLTDQIKMLTDLLMTRKTRQKTA